jgi:hypothetical protein
MAALFGEIQCDIIACLAVRGVWAIGTIRGEEELRCNAIDGVDVVTEQSGQHHAEEVAKSPHVAPIHRLMAYSELRQEYCVLNHMAGQDGDLAGAH